MAPALCGSTRDAYPNTAIGVIVCCHSLAVAQEPTTGEAEGLGAAEAEASRAPDLPGPFPVGAYARVLQRELRKRARVLLIGEVTGFSQGRVQAYFDLRDGDGAVTCSIWLSDLEKLDLPEGALRDGVAVVVGGGPDYYPGSAQSSPSFSFRATHLRLAGEGDLLARLAALRRKLQSEGLFEPQKQLPRPLLPKTIGVVTAEGGAARRTCSPGWSGGDGAGRSSGPSPRSRTASAAPAITAAISDLAGSPRSRRSSSPAAAAASPTSGPSATRPSAARWRCCGCR